MENHVLLATIRRARGIRGEVIATNEGSPVERFEAGLIVSLTSAGSDDRKLATIERARDQNGDLVLQFREWNTRDEAESLRGWQVWMPETERPPAPEGEYYLGDLVGCDVLTVTGESIGVVRAWHDFGAGPLLEVERPGKGEALIPFTSAFYREVDLSALRIVMELPEGLLDLNS